MTTAITTRQVPEVRILSLRDQIPADAFPAFLGRTFGQLYGHVGRHGVTTLGHPFVIYHAFGPDRIDAEVCVPVAADPPVGEGLTVRTLPAATVAEVLHVGPYEALATTYEALAQWISDHGFATAGPIRERYLTGPADDVSPSEYRTEIEQPIEAAAVAAAH